MDDLDFKKYKDTKNAKLKYITIFRVLGLIIVFSVLIYYTT